LAVFTFATYLISLITYAFIGVIIDFISFLIFQEPLFDLNIGGDLLFSLEGIILVAIVTASAYGVAGLDLKNGTLYRKIFDSQVKDYDDVHDDDNYAKKFGTEKWKEKVNQERDISNVLIEEHKKTKEKDDMTQKEMIDSINDKIARLDALEEE